MGRPDGVLRSYHAGLGARRASATCCPSRRTSTRPPSSTTSSYGLLAANGSTTGTLTQVSGPTTSSTPDPSPARVRRSPRPRSPCTRPRSFHRAPRHSRSSLSSARDVRPLVRAWFTCVAVLGQPPCSTQPPGPRVPQHLRRTRPLFSVRTIGAPHLRFHHASRTPLRLVSRVPSSPSRGPSLPSHVSAVGLARGTSLGDRPRWGRVAGAAVSEGGSPSSSPLLRRAILSLRPACSLEGLLSGYRTRFRGLLAPLAGLASVSPGSRRGSSAGLPRLHRVLRANCPRRRRPSRADITEPVFGHRPNTSPRSWRSGREAEPRVTPGPPRCAPGLASPRTPTCPQRGRPPLGEITPLQAAPLNALRLPRAELFPV